MSGPDASSAARTSSGSTPTGAHAKQSSAPSTASSTESGRAVDRAALDRGAQALGVAAEAHDLGALDVLLRRQADRAADQPHAEDGYAHGRLQAPARPRAQRCHPTVVKVLPASSAAASSLRR